MKQSSIIKKEKLNRFRMLMWNVYFCENYHRDKHTKKSMTLMIVNYARYISFPDDSLLICSSLSKWIAKWNFNMKILLFSLQKSFFITHRFENLFKKGRSILDRHQYRNNTGWSSCDKSDYQIDVSFFVFCKLICHIF